MKTLLFIMMSLYTGATIWSVWVWSLSEYSLIIPIIFIGLWICGMSGMIKEAIEFNKIP